MKQATTLSTVSASPQEELAALRANMVAENPSFDNLLPEVTRDSLRDFGSAIFSYQPLQNAFIESLVNLIGRTWITYRLFTNPLRALKKGILEYGDTVEMLYTQIARAHQFDPAVAEKEWMKREIPDVITAFAHKNYTVFYKQTISDDMLRAAFMSWQGLSNFISSVFNAMYTGAELNEYVVMKNQLAAYNTAHKFATVEMGAITSQATAQTALAKLKAASNKLTFMSASYNGAGVVTATPKEKQVLIVDADSDAYLSVLGYGTLFNLEPARTQYRVIVVDEIPIDGCHAILMDEDFYAVWDCLQKFTRDMNGEGLYWNYWAHYWRAFAVCPWANAIAFVETVGAVTAVAVTPATQTITPGSNYQFTATPTGTGVFNGAVTWSITGAASSDTYISPMGKLYVASNETAKTITVKATSVATSTVSGTATVTVSGN